MTSGQKYKLGRHDRSYIHSILVAGKIPGKLERLLWMAFVALEKAFDRVPVPREVDWWVPRYLGTGRMDSVVSLCQ